tara:strand:- start:11950 stop:12660 length:711 start_codon:yes stop_codon:yes gene_type:complete
MTNFWRSVGAAALLCVLAACASKPSIPYDSSQANSIKTIGLLTPGGPSGPRAILATTVGQSFGLVGALIDAGMAESRESDLRALFRGQNFAADDIVIAEVTASLQARGYTVVNVPVTRTDHALKKSYSGMSGSADAYLDMMYHYGYISAGIAGSTPYRPFFYADVRLVKASDSSVLMEDSIFYNPMNAPKGRVVISPSPDYAFPKFDNVTSNPEKVTEGMRLAIHDSADAIGKLLK